MPTPTTQPPAVPGQRPPRVIGQTSGRPGGIAGISGGFNTGGSTFFSGPIGDPVVPERAVVAMPSPGDYLAGLGAAPQVGAAERTNAASQIGIHDAMQDVHSFRGEYNNPTEGAAFQNLMSLAGETTSAAVGDINRQAQTAASRAGYTGGFSARGRQADAERLKAVSRAGFEGAHEIRGEALEGYGVAKTAATSLITEYNRARTTEAMANADRAAQASMQQAAINLEHMGMGMQAHQAYANAKSEAQQLQAQLDRDYQSQRIDASRYTQMSNSVAAQFAAQMAQLEEESRQFDVNTAFREKEFEENVRRYGREEALRLAAQGRNQAGQSFGPMRPAARQPGAAFATL